MSKLTDIIGSITAWHHVAGSKDTTLAIKLIQEEYKEVMEAALSGDDIYHTAQEAADLVFVAINLIYQLGLQPASVIEEITISNYSKFIPKNVYTDRKEEIDNYCSENNFSLEEVELSKDTTVYCVKDENGKLKKGMFYKGVDYDKFITYKNEV